MTATLDQKLYNLAVSAVADVERYCEYTMTPEKLLEVMKQSKSQAYFIDEVNETEGYDETPALRYKGLDTCVRDKAFDVIAQHATGRSWPTYGTSKEETDTFWAAINAFFEGAQA